MGERPSVCPHHRTNALGTPVSRNCLGLNFVWLESKEFIAKSTYYQAPIFKRQRQLNFERFRQFRIDLLDVGGKHRQLKIDPPPLMVDTGIELH